MVLWTFAFLLGFLAIPRVWNSGTGLILSLRGEAGEHSLDRVARLSQALQDQLHLGRAIDLQDFQEWLRSLDYSWQILFKDSLTELRSAGAPVLPTLKSIQQTALAQKSTLQLSRAKSSQAILQAFVLGGLIPLVSATLWFAVPELQSQTRVWILVTVCSGVLALLAVTWIFHLADRVRYGGLSSRHRNWVWVAPCAMLRLQALLRAARPPDLAWVETLCSVQALAPELIELWGHSFWEAERTSPGIWGQLGLHTKKAMKVSLLQGTPCLDKIEGLLESQRLAFNSEVEREIQKLPVRVLQPLFLLILPALVLLLASVFFLVFTK